MNNVKSSAITPTPRKVSYTVPTTRQEFSRLEYAQRVQLLKDHPDVYKRFSDTRKPWER